MSSVHVLSQSSVHVLWHNVHFLVFMSYDCVHTCIVHPAMMHTRMHTTPHKHPHTYTPHSHPPTHKHPHTPHTPSPTPQTYNGEEGEAAADVQQEGHDAELPGAALHADHEANPVGLVQRAGTRPVLHLVVVGIPVGRRAQRFCQTTPQTRSSNSTAYSGWPTS